MGVSRKQIRQGNIEDYSNIRYSIRQRFVFEGNSVTVLYLTRIRMHERSAMLTETDVPTRIEIKSGDLRKIHVCV